MEVNLAVAVALVLFSLVLLMGALAVWRSLRSARTAIRGFEITLDDRSHVVRGRLLSSTEDLIAMRHGTEQALWTLQHADERIDAASAALAARRRGSDTLRARIVQSQPTLARFREAARLVIRAIELRRELLG